MRYRRHVSISLHELSQLLTAWNKFATDPQELGECVLGESYAGIVKQLDEQCVINITPTQLYNLCWYYKQAVIERLEHLHKKLPNNYYELMKRLKTQAPELFMTLPDGEIVLKEGKEVLGCYDEE